MKKNSWTMKMLVGGFAMAMIISMSSASAGEMKLTRQGRFVKHVVTLEAPAPVLQSKVAAADQGKYERKGRFLKRTVQSVTRDFDRPEVASANTRHEHGVNGKGHKNLSN